MSEVDRLSNSGLYPALPIGERRRRREQADDGTPQSGGEAAGPAADRGAADGSDTSSTGLHRIPKSLIDEYA